GGSLILDNRIHATPEYAISLRNERPAAGKLVITGKYPGEHWQGHDPGAGHAGYDPWGQPLQGHTAAAEPADRRSAAAAKPDPRQHGSPQLPPAGYPGYGDGRRCPRRPHL